jgi:uncharacterized protein YndB with AHSA1/START domain
MAPKITALENGHDIIVERDFNAGIELVFEIFSNPEYLMRWQFPEGAGLEIEKHDCNTGGRYLSWHKGPNNMKFGFTGVFHEVKAPELIIQTSEFLGLPFKVIPTLEITKLEAINPELTKLTKHIICVSNEVRNAMLQNGMEQHFTGSFIRIDDILKNK